MRSEVLNRFFSFITALLLLLVFCFMISRMLPGEKLRMSAQPSQGLRGDHKKRQAAIEKAYRLLGYDLPLFYCSLSSFVVPDSFVRCPSPLKRSALVTIAYRSAQPALTYSTWNYIYGKYGLLQPFDLSSGKDSESVLLRKDITILQQDTVIQRALLELNSPSLASRLLRYIPAISFSMDNQFHQWLFGTATPGLTKGILRGDLGNSLSSGKSVKSLMGYSFLFSFSIAFFVLLVTIPIGIIIGAVLALYRNSRLTKLAIAFFVFFYNIPSFLFAIALVYLFANPGCLNWFPSSGPVLDTEHGVVSWIVSLFGQWEYMVLPLVLLSASSFVYISQLVFETLVDELRKPYALTLKATGYKESYILRNQLLKNAVLPVFVTMINIFPSLVSGSLLVDYFFSLNGLGVVLVNANEQHDFPVLAATFLVTGILSVLALYLSDYLIRKVDPRVKMGDVEWVGGGNE